MVGVVRRFLFERGSSVKVCLKCLSIFDDAVRFCPYHGAELRPFVGRTYEAGESVCGYYLQKKNIPQLARERGVNKSTICRTLQRAERRLRRFLKY